MLRDVKISDAKAIADIYKYYVEQTTVSFDLIPRSVSATESLISNVSSHYPFIVYEDGGSVIGYAYVHAWKDRPAYGLTAETSIYLHPDCCGKGYGLELMERLIDRCRHIGLHALVACITAENTGSIEFHSRLGFKQVSCFEQVGEKFGRYLDVVDMELIL